MLFAFAYYYFDVCIYCLNDLTYLYDRIIAGIIFPFNIVLSVQMKKLVI